jgi:hypothetical protein
MQSNPVATIKEARALHVEVVKTIKNAKLNFLELGSYLSILRKDDLYKQAVGEGIDTWDDYLSQPEIGLSKGEASRFMQIYEIFVERFGFNPKQVSEISLKNIQYLLPLAKECADKGEVQTLLSEAKSLTRQDFKDRIQEIRHSDDILSYEYIVMTRCDQTGRLERIWDIPEAEIISLVKKYDSNK